MVAVHEQPHPDATVLVADLDGHRARLRAKRGRNTRLAVHAQQRVANRVEVLDRAASELA
ncbi:MAG: hypothetical protein ACRDYA_04450 [Egibacteraceae bacterium]